MAKAVFSVSIDGNLCCQCAGLALWLSLSLPGTTPPLPPRESANGSRKPLRSSRTCPQRHSRPRRGWPRASRHHPDSSCTRPVQSSRPFSSLCPLFRFLHNAWIHQKLDPGQFCCLSQPCLPALLSHQQTMDTPLETPTSRAVNPLA